MSKPRPPGIAAAVRRAKRRERERCAKIAESWKSSLRPGTEARLWGHEEAAREIAAAIRALVDPTAGAHP